jgi:hypothetical protein
MNRTIALLLLMNVSVGCLSRPALVHKTFALHATGGIQSTKTGSHGILALGPVRVCPLFESRSFVYRIGPDLYEADPYAEFIIPPGRALAIPVGDYLRGWGVFETVLEPSTPLKADASLEVHAPELYGDFRRSAPPAAVLSLKFLMFRSEREPKLLFQREYSRRVPLKEASADALVAGWNQALAEIMTEADSDIASACSQITAGVP